MTAAPTAVVFAYHNVGVRCLSVLLAHGVNVLRVITHADNPNENIWFDSVRRLAELNGLPCAIPDDPNASAQVDSIRTLRPDFIFSFYYRHMLGQPVLDCARRGAYNMHGSLLPKYRGRVPVNWAVIKGERHTGATLHRMVAKPDAGDIAAQCSVPILPDDTAFDVFQKVTVAAEIALDDVLPRLIDGTATLKRMDIANGSYFGGRKPEDGRIDWRASAQDIHNLIRGVAPPYPGAFGIAQGKKIRILRSRIDSVQPVGAAPTLYADGSRLLFHSIDARAVEFLEVEHDGQLIDARGFARLFGASSIALN